MKFPMPPAKSPAVQPCGLACDVNEHCFIRMGTKAQKGKGLPGFEKMCPQCEDEISQPVKSNLL
jgi:hypothetical protein